MRLLLIAALGLSSTVTAAPAVHRVDAGTVAASLTSEAPDAGPLVDPTAELEKRIEGLEQKSAEVEGQRAELARQVEELRAQRTQDLSALERGLAALREVPAVISKLGVKVSLTGFVHTDFQWHQSSEEQLDPATRDPLNLTRFLVRRARLRPEVEYGPIAGSIEADFNTVAGAQVRIVGAEVSARWVPEGAAGPLLMGTVGLFKIPFGLEVPQSDRERFFVERSSVVRSLFPGEYDLGARVRGEWRFLRYAVALMNGKPIGEAQLSYKAPIAPRDVMGRVGVDVAPVPAVRIEAGFSGLVGTGFHAGSAATKDQIVWRDTNGDNIAQAGELQIIPGQPAQPSSTFPRQALGGDVRVTFELPVLGKTQLQGELVWSKNLDRLLLPSDPVALGRDLRGLGWHLGLTQELTRSFMVGVRYDRYNPDLDALESRSGQVVPKDQSYSTLAVTAGFLYRPVLRFLVEFDHNTNALGRDASGQPTVLLDDAVIVRGEVAF